jgi:hypothetical protein
VVVQGLLTADVVGVFQATTNITYTKDILVGTFTFDSITFDVGIPIHITPSVPLHLGATVGIFG